MGYYDREAQRYEGERPPAKRPKGRWFSSFISACIGGLLVLLFIPVLSGTGLYPYEPVSDDEEVSSEPADTPTQMQETSVEVTSGITEIVDDVADAIVGVVNVRQGVANFFEEHTDEEEEAGVGSGVIFDTRDGEALIVTNYHVIQEADGVEISLANGEREQAEVVGADPLTDLAVLTIDDEHVEQVAEFGDSDSLSPGEPAIAIGNPLGLEFSRTVTQGVISGVERSLEVFIEDIGQWELNVIQTDAAINPGNSGGALLNIDGQVIGINSLKIGQSPAGVGGSQPAIEGMGFAIPSNDAIPVIESLIEHGEVQRPQLGVTIADLAQIHSYHRQETLNLPSEVTEGVIVDQIASQSPADQAGLQRYDVIVEIEGEEIKNSVKLRQVLYEQNVGDTIEVSFYRDGDLMSEEIELTEGVGYESSTEQ